MPNPSEEWSDDIGVKKSRHLQCAGMDFRLRASVFSRRLKKFVEPVATKALQAAITGIVGGIVRYIAEQLVALLHQ